MQIIMIMKERMTALIIMEQNMKEHLLIQINGLVG